MLSALGKTNPILPVSATGMQVDSTAATLDIRLETAHASDISELPDEILSSFGESSNKLLDCPPTANLVSQRRGTAATGQIRIIHSQQNYWEDSRIYSAGVYAKLGGLYSWYFWVYPLLCIAWKRSTNHGNQVSQMIVVEQQNQFETYFRIPFNPCRIKNFECIVMGLTKSFRSITKTYEYSLNSGINHTSHDDTHSKSNDKRKYTDKDHKKCLLLVLTFGGKSNPQSYPYRRDTDNNRGNCQGGSDAVESDTKWIIAATCFVCIFLKKTAYSESLIIASHPRCWSTKFRSRHLLCKSNKAKRLHHR